MSLVSALLIALFASIALSTFGAESSPPPPPAPIEDSIWIKAPPARVFKALTDADELSHWWPKAAETEPKKDGKIVLTWFNDGKMSSTFETFVTDKEVSFPFYTEKVTFTLTEKNNGTTFSVRHQCGPDTALHIAAAWGHLTVFLKSWVEHGIDLHKD